MNLGKYIIDTLKKYGAEHVFGIPGDYTLNFIKEITEHSEVEYVGVSREDSAGYAADAYGRMRGCGVACITYSVGAMNTMNAVAGAYAERSPMVIISGTPTKKDLNLTKYKHHTIVDENTQRNIFDEITCASITLDSDDMSLNLKNLKHALESMRSQSQPIYIEFSNEDCLKEVTEEDIKDMKKWDYIDALTKVDKFIQKQSSERAYISLERFTQEHKDSKNKVIIVGHEIFRNCLEKEIEDISIKLNIPVFTTILGKSTVNEHHPLSLGCISQLCTDESITKAVGNSDCIISLGIIESDLESFSFKPHLSLNMEEGLFIYGENIDSGNDFTIDIQNLISLLGSHQKQEDSIIESWHNLIQDNTESPPSLDLSKELPTLSHVFHTIGKFVDERHIILSDIGESLFGMIDIPVNQGSFISLAYYTSMSFSVPGAIGIKFAKPNKRPIVIVGDGAFHMSGSEFSSHIKHDLNSIVIILNNKGYSTERAIMEGDFNNIQNWNYEKITDLVGGGIGKTIDSSIRFQVELGRAITDEDNSYVFNVHLDSTDMSSNMKALISMCK